MICFESSSLIIYYFTAKDLIIIHWLAAPNDWAYREAWQLMLKLGREKKVRNWLVNSQNIEQLSINNINWLYENWYPHFLQIPTEKYACLAANDVNYLLALEAMFDYRKQNIPFDFQFFSDMNSALEWIKEEMPISAAF